MTTESNPDENKELAEQDYQQLLEQYRQELRTFQFVRKKEIVLSLAQALERQGVDPDRISTKLTEDLTGYDISERYIRECLGEEFKQSAKKRQKFAALSAANNSKESEKPAIITTTTNGHASYDEEMKALYNEPTRNGNHAEETDRVLNLLGEIKDKNLKIGQLEEQMAEQKQQIQELIKSVNAQLDLKKDKPPTVTESLEYKNVVAQNQVLEQRIAELEEIVKKSIRENPAVGFQTATNLQSNDCKKPTEYQPTTTIKFPANLIGQFFIQGRNVKQCMVLKLDDKGNVEGWEVQ